MNDIKHSIYTKLNSLIDEELEKENPDTEIISESVNGILRLIPQEAYSMTAGQREQNILEILNEKPKRRFNSKFVKVLIAAAIITVLLVGSVFAYTIIEYTIHDYETYSTVWSNIIPKRIDKPVVASYIPEGFELVDSEDSKYCSAKTYQKDETYITISKDSFKSVNINTEFGKTNIVKINGIDYIFFGEEVHGKGIVWFSDNYLYTIVANLADEELLKIAQSIS
mgnify:CR=1 FL=1